jgi:drug/metabolite transporter (DMT)-like permease
MKAKHWLILFTLAGISGSSFIFTRQIAPVFGPIGTADLRILIAGAALLLYILAVRGQVGWKNNWLLYAVIGVLNSGLPFLFVSFAAVTLPASYLAILNASAPVFGGLFSAIWLGERLTAFKIGGMVLGMLGVGLLTYSGGTSTEVPHFTVSVLASLAAAVCYALSGIFIKRRAKHIKPLAMAACSQFSAGLLMLPFYATSSTPGHVSTMVVIDLLAVALLCSAVAYLLYFKLIAEVGPTKTLTVTFLSPMFAMAAAYLALGETITVQMCAGAVVIVLATLAVNRPSAPRAALARPAIQPQPGSAA